MARGYTKKRPHRRAHAPRRAHKRMHAPRRGRRHGAERCRRVKGGKRTPRALPKRRRPLPPRRALCRNAASPAAAPSERRQRPKKDCRAINDLAAPLHGERRTMPGAVLCKPRKSRVYAFKEPYPHPAPPAKAMQKPRFHAETRLLRPILPPPFRCGNAAATIQVLERRSFAADGASAVSSRLCGLPSIQNALSKKLYSARCQLPMEW